MFGFGEDFLAERLLFLLPLWLSLGVHEWAHAYSAAVLGDDTAARAGRLTLNPLEHIDPVGTLLLPLLGVPFGWAKPVPITPAKFHQGMSMRTGLVLTAAAGPISNLVLALLGTLLLALAVPLGGGAGAERLLETVILLNVLLAFVNALPIPPLDGSRIVDGLLPDAWRTPWNAFSRVGPLALGVVVVAPLLFGMSPLGPPLEWTREWIGAVRSLIDG